MPTFELRRVVFVATGLAYVAAVAGFWLGGIGASAGILIGTGLSCLAFVFLERSLRKLGPDSHVFPLMLSSTVRMGFLAIVGVAAASLWGVPGGAGFLAGIFFVKAAVLAEGVRSGGG